MRAQSAIRNERKMKIRIGFVSNSSSASMVLDTRRLKKKQIKAIDKYLSTELNTDGWRISKQNKANDVMRMYFTFMDNGDFSCFLKEIDIPYKAIAAYDGGL